LPFGNFYVVSADGTSDFVVTSFFDPNYVVQTNPNGGRVTIRASGAAGFVNPLLQITNAEEYTGFEVAIFERQWDEDKNGVGSPVRLRRHDVTFRFAESLGIINIYEIGFIPNIGNVDVTGSELNNVRNKIFVEITAFHTNGDNVIIVMELPTGIQAWDDDTLILLASVISMPSQIEVMRWYDMPPLINTLPQYEDAFKRYSLRRIMTNNGLFSIMGNNFRANTMGEFQISYFWDGDDFIVHRQIVIAVNTETPQWIFSKPMPSSLLRSNDLVRLPAVLASMQTAEVITVVQITAPNGSVNVYCKDKILLTYDDPIRGDIFFRPKRIGVYTIRFTAIIDNVAFAGLEFEIQVRNALPPNNDNEIIEAPTNDVPSNTGCNASAVGILSSFLIMLSFPIVLIKRQVMT